MIIEIILSSVFVLLGLYLEKIWISILAIVLFCGWIFYKYFLISEEFSFKFSDDERYREAGKIDIYCGSDLILPDGYDEMGTRNRCLKKGVGVGMSMSTSERNRIIAKPAPPVPREKIYCGDKAQLPPGYDRFATLGECLRKGVGIGARMPEDKIRDWTSKAPKTMSKHEIYQLAHRYKIPTNQTRKRVIRQIAETIERTAA